MKINVRSNKGTTLIELVVVLLLIGMLGSMISFVVRSAGNHYKNSESDKNNQTQARTAMSFLSGEIRRHDSSDYDTAYSVLQYDGVYILEQGTTTYSSLNLDNLPQAPATSTSVIYIKDKISNVTTGSSFSVIYYDGDVLKKVNADTESGFNSPSNTFNITESGYISGFDVSKADREIQVIIRYKYNDVDVDLKNKITLRSQPN